MRTIQTGMLAYMNLAAAVAAMPPAPREHETFGAYACTACGPSGLQHTYHRREHPVQVTRIEMRERRFRFAKVTAYYSV